MLSDDALREIRCEPKAGCKGVCDGLDVSYAREVRLTSSIDVA
jgi:hypothetical protein